MGRSFLSISARSRHGPVRANLSWRRLSASEILLRSKLTNIQARAAERTGAYGPVLAVHHSLLSPLFIAIVIPFVVLRANRAVRKSQPSHS